LVVRELWKVRGLSSFSWLFLWLHLLQNLPFDGLELH
jgi:hypothetical protein